MTATEIAAVFTAVVGAVATLAGAAAAYQRLVVDRRSARSTDAVNVAGAYSDLYDDLRSELRALREQRDHDRELIDALGEEMALLRTEVSTLKEENRYLRSEVRSVHSEIDDLVRGIGILTVQVVNLGADPDWVLPARYQRVIRSNPPEEPGAEGA